MREAKRIMACVFMMAVMVAALAGPVEAGNQYIQRTFVFDGVAPQVTFEHGLYDWAITNTNDGGLKWAKKTPYNKRAWDDFSQSFTILPASAAGYYVIQEVTTEHSQRVLTYTPKGFVMEYPDRATGYTAAQMFRLKWYNTTTAGGKTVKNCWKLVCKKNNVCFCVGGWASVQIMWTNAPD